MILIGALGVATMAMLAPSAPSAPPPVGPLTIGLVDRSGFPQVQVDIVVPQPLSAVELQPTMVDVDGAPIESLTAVDPRRTAVALIIDDRPELDEDVVTALQGATVELVRNVGTGTEISLGTPSGLLSAPTADQAANIARIAGITAGAPAVAPLPQLVTDAVTELGSSARPDRHAVVVLGADPEASLPEIYRLIDAIAATGTKLHLAMPRAVEAGSLAAVAEDSGGVVALAPGFLAAIDEVTAAIARRYSVVASVSGEGEHRVGLTVDDRRYEGVFSVAAPATPPPAPPATAPPPTPAPVVTTPATVPVATEPASGVTQSETQPRTRDVVPSRPPAGASDDDGSRGLLPVVVVPLVALLAGAATYLVLGRRKPRRRRILRIMGELPPAPVPTAEAASTEQSAAADEATPYPAAELSAAEEPTPELAVESAAEQPTAEDESPPEPAEPELPVVAAAAAEVTRRRWRRLGRRRALAPPPDRASEGPAPERTADELTDEAAALAVDATAEPALPVEAAELSPEPAASEPEAAVEHAAPAAPAAKLPGRPVDRREPRPARRAAPPPRRRSRASEASGARSTTRGSREPDAPDAAVARRGRDDAADSADDWIVSGHLRLSPSRQEAWTARRPIRLSTGEYRVLELLVRNGNEGVTEEEIIAAGGLDEESDDTEAFVARIRRKTGFGRRQHGVRKQSTVTYYLDDSEAP